MNFIYLFPKLQLTCFLEVIMNYDFKNFQEPSRRNANSATNIILLSDQHVYRIQRATPTSSKRSTVEN